MICKKCGHDVDKYEVIMVANVIFKTFGRPISEPHCPCGEKIT